jgi:hypothetical protein
MSEDIKVSVVEFSDRKFYLMQWRDPFTGKKCTLSTKVERTGTNSHQTPVRKTQ